MRQINSIRRGWYLKAISSPSESRFFQVLGMTVLILFSFLRLPVLAQDRETTQAGSSGSMQLGISWYPERRAPQLWEHDIQMMVDAGIKRVRMAEFAWSTIEPSAGEYHWEWLDRAINLATAHDLDVVLCTPTATPPVWLIERTRRSCQ